MDINYEELFGLEPEEEPAGEEEQEAAEPAEDMEEDLGEEDQEIAVPDADGEGEEEPEEEPEEKPEGKKAQSPEERRAQAAARRQREQQAAIDAAVAAERQKNQKAWDDHYKAMNIRDPYNGNKLVETKADYDAYVAARDRQTLERDLKAGKVTAERYQQQVREEASRQAAEQMQRQQREDEGRAEVQRQFDALKAAEPSVGSLEDVMRDPVFVAALKVTHDMTKAYRMAHVDEIEARAKGAASAARNSGKDHLRRAGTRGGGAPSIDQDIINSYRLFDPDITMEEIRKHQAQYQKTRKR